MPRIGRSRLLNTVLQFRQLRLQLASLGGLVMVLVAALVDPQSVLGVILVSLGTGVLASSVVAAVALEREDFAQSVLGLGVQEVFHDRSTAFDNDFWNGLIKAASHRFNVLGVANHGYLRNQTIKDQTREEITHAIQHGVEVEVLWLNPEHMLAKFREEEEERRGTRDDTIDSILFFSELRGTLPRERQTQMVLKEHESLPTCGITWSDDLLIVTHYLAEQLNLGSPGFVLGPSMSLLDRLVELVRRKEPKHPKITEAYMSNYREISDDARVIDDSRVEHLKSMRGSWGPASSARQSEATLRELHVDNPSTEGTP